MLWRYIDDLNKLGGLASDIKISDYSGKLVSTEEFLDKEIEHNFESVTKVLPYSNLDSRYNAHIANAKKINLPDRPQSLASKVLEILNHSRLENSYKEPMHIWRKISEDAINKRSEKLKILIATKPHEELYEKVLAIKSYAGCIEHAILCCNHPMVHGSNQNLSEADAVKENEAGLKKMINERPHPYLYDQITIPV